jgi:DNA polymerase-3 subunit delta'
MIIGHQKQKDFLKKIAKEDGRSMLFTGSQFLGKKTIALDFLSLIFNEKPDQHPDFILIEPEKGRITIDQIRELSQRISLKPIRSQSFGVIIDQAHLMNRAAQNCFLKTLEEPKSNSFIILVAEYPKLLLPTIISRCEMVKFYPVPRNLIKNYLEKRGLSSDKIKKILDISLGRPGKAIEYLEKPEKLKEREKTIQELVKIIKSPLSDRFDYVKVLAKKDNLEEVLTIWLAYLRKKFIESGEKKALRFKEVLSAIEKTIYLIVNTNTSRKLALEALVIKF